MKRNALAVVLMIAGSTLLMPEEAFGGVLGKIIKEAGKVAGGIVGAPLKIVGKVAGGDVGKVVGGLGEAASGLVEGTTGLVGDGVTAVEHGIQHIAGELDDTMEGIEKEVCNGPCITIGATVDSRGNVNGYDPTTGQTIDGSSNHSTAPTDQDIASFEDFRSSFGGEYILWHRLDDGAGIERFLPQHTLPGDPCPDCPLISAPTSKGEIRSGATFTAVRDSKEGREGKRLHAAVDYVTTPGEPIYASIDGTQVRIGRTETGLPLVEISSPNRLKARALYLEPTPQIRMYDALRKKGIDTPVSRGELIGFAKDIQPVYGKETPNHIHLTIELPGGLLMSPDKKHVSTDERRSQGTSP